MTPLENKAGVKPPPGHADNHVRLAEIYATGKHRHLSPVIHEQQKEDKEAAPE